MCKLLTQSHACGHSITLERDSCFLVKNKFQCMNEEKRLLRASRDVCERCRKLQRKIQLAGAIPSPVKRQDNPPSSGEASQKPPAPKLTRPDPSRIIADLKALCAKVAAEQRAEVTSKPNSMRQDSAKVEIHVRKTSIASTSKQVRAPREVSGPGDIPYSVHGGRPVKSDLISEFLNEMDPYASGSNLEKENHRSPKPRQPWTRDSSDRAASFEVRGGTVRPSTPSQFPLLSSGRIAKGQRKPSLRLPTPSDTRTDSNSAKSYATSAGPRARRHTRRMCLAHPSEQRRGISMKCWLESSSRLQA
jgi:hypothetical protein